MGSELRVCLRYILPLELGFFVYSINQIGDTRSTLRGRKYTLLHHMCDIIAETFPNLAAFPEEITSIHNGAKGLHSLGPTLEISSFS
jgi:hypothetical protein